MICEKCNKEHDGYYGSGRFCSAQCARGFSTKERREEISNKVSLTLGGKGKNRSRNSVCPICNKPVGRNKKTCSRECAQELRWKNIEANGKWQDTLNPAPIKKYLIARNGYKCEICKTEIWNGKPIPLVLDHIDGNSDNVNLNNFRLVCRNCDGQLETFAGKNVGKGNSKKRWKSMIKSYTKKII